VHSDGSTFFRLYYLLTRVESLFLNPGCVGLGYSGGPCHRFLSEQGLQVSSHCALQ